MSAVDVALRDVQLGVPPQPVVTGEPHPPIVVILLTYQRTDYALATIRSARECLRYAGEIWWYVADDGSRPEHVAAVLAALDGTHVLGWHSERAGYGMNATKAWYMALQFNDVALFLEDDWIMRGETDVTPWVNTLVKHDDLAMIRLAHLAVGLRCEIVGYDGRHYLSFDMGTNMAFCGNPALRHRRARMAWGAYPAGLNPGDTELAYDAQVRASGGPRIIAPVDIGGWGVFGHIGAVPSYTIKKGGE